MLRFLASSCASKRFVIALANLFHVRDTGLHETATLSASGSAPGSSEGDGGVAVDGDETKRGRVARVRSLLPFSWRFCLPPPSSHCRPPIGHLSVRLMALSWLGWKLIQHLENTGSWVRWQRTRSWCNGCEWHCERRKNQKSTRKSLWPCWVRTLMSARPKKEQERRCPLAAGSAFSPTCLSRQIDSDSAAGDLVRASNATHVADVSEQRAVVPASKDGG